MGTLAALKARADNMTTDEAEEAIGILLGSGDHARSKMTRVLRCPDGSQQEFHRAGRHVEQWWQAIACVAELLYGRGLIESDTLAAMLSNAMCPYPDLPLDDPSRYPRTGAGCSKNP
jgi:hypothetical protein